MQEHINHPFAKGTTIEYCLRQSNKHETGRVLDSGMYVVLVLNAQGYNQFVFFDEIINTITEAREVSVGSIIAYRLLPSQLPVNPNKVWRGRVVKNYPLVQMAYVELLEDGYRGLREYVYYRQVKSIDRNI